MKIDKAIEILEKRVASPFARANPDTKDAMGLGIEALKYLEHLRKSFKMIRNVKLPGESPREERR